MSQLVALTAGDFALMASDRNVIVYGEEGETRLSLKKLFAPAGKTLLSSSGASVGITISGRFEKMMEGKDLKDFDHMADYAALFFQREYDEFIKKGADWFAKNPECLKLAYFLLAGRKADGSPGLRFYASESHSEPFRLLNTGTVVTAPRRIGLEAALSKAVACGAGMDDIKVTVIKALAKIESVDQAVRGPFDIAVVGPDGLKMETVEQI